MPITCWQCGGVGEIEINRGSIKCGVCDGTGLTESQLLQSSLNDKKEEKKPLEQWQQISYQPLYDCRRSMGEDIRIEFFRSFPEQREGRWPGDTNYPSIMFGSSKFFVSEIVFSPPLPLKSSVEFILGSYVLYQMCGHWKHKFEQPFEIRTDINFVVIARGIPCEVDQICILEGAMYRKIVG